MEPTTERSTALAGMGGDRRSSGHRHRRAPGTALVQLIDYAAIEMRIRDVWSGHPPLLGAYARFGAPGQEASHPGPLMFFVMWPLYQVFGATAWAMQAATACLHAAAVAAALWIAHRRVGTTGTLGFAAAIAVLARYYGAFTLTDPWNPYVCVLWWLVFLLAVWSVACGDLPMLPVAAVVGTLCVQAHVGYVGLTVGLGGLALAAASLTAVRQRGERNRSLPLVRSSVLTAAIGGLTWAPPLFEEVTHRRGNLSKLWPTSPTRPKRRSACGPASNCSYTT